MGPLSGTRVRVAAGCLLLSLAAASCTSSGPAAGQSPQETGPISGTPVPGIRALPTAVAGPPTTRVPKGCQSGLVTITHYVMETVPSTVCIKMGAVLRLMLRSSDGNWGVLVTPTGAARVTSATSPTVVRFIISATGTVPFCLSVSASPLYPTDEVNPPWQLCVTVRLIRA
jgi:hypothetical protein